MNEETIEVQALKIFNTACPEVRSLYDARGNLNDCLHVLSSRGATKEQLQDSSERIDRIADLLLQNVPEDFGVVTPGVHRASQTLMKSMLLLLRDWFPAKDLSLKGLGTLLTLAEVRVGDPTFQSALDLMFKQVDEGVKYVNKSNDWTWQPTRFRRNYDFADPSTPAPGTTEKGIPHGQDAANDAYRLYRDQAGQDAQRVIMLCQSCFAPFCALLGEKGKDLMETFAAGPAGTTDAINRMIAQCTPSNIIKVTLRDVIGQDFWVERLSKNVYQQLLCIRQRHRNAEDAPASRVIVGVGTTGMGKTFGVRKVAEAMGMPFFSINAASLTGAGYKGQNLTEALRPICAEQKNFPGRPVLVFVDEIDKTGYGRKGESDDFNTQKDFLTLLDGGLKQIPADRDEGEQTLNADDVIWVFAGAFTGIHEYVKDRLKEESGSSSVGFINVEGEDPSHLDEEQLREHITQEDLIAWGFGREFCGRLGTIVNIPPLSKESFAEIARKHVKQYAGLLPGGVEFTLSEEAIEEVAEKGVTSGLGARYIDSLIGPLSEDALAESADRVDLQACNVVFDKVSGFTVEYAYAGE